jgi:hypothetical protein
MSLGSSGSVVDARNVAGNRSCPSIATDSDFPPWHVVEQELSVLQGVSCALHRSRLGRDVLRRKVFPGQLSRW